MKLKYAIVGSGALGGYYGGKLAHSGQSVHFLFNSDYKHVADHGLRVDSVNGNFHLQTINAYPSAHLMPKSDVVFVCLKTTNNHLLQEILPPLIHDNTIVILIQNGLGIEYDLSLQFPNLAIGGGLAFICSSKLGDGHIAHFDEGKLTIGSYKNTDSQMMIQIKEDLIAAGIPTEITPDLNLSRWKKLIWNIPYNGMTVVLNSTTDSLMKHQASRNLLHDLMLEVIEAANHCGLSIPTSFAQHMLETTDKMRPYAPSMKLDYDAHRPLEIEAIYTRPIQTALQAGYNMSKTTMLQQQLRYLQSTYM